MFSVFDSKSIPPVLHPLGSSKWPKALQRVPHPSPELVPPRCEPTVRGFCFEKRRVVRVDLKDFWGKSCLIVCRGKHWKNFYEFLIFGNVFLINDGFFLWEIDSFQSGWKCL